MNDYDEIRQLVQIRLKREKNPTKEIIQQKVEEIIFKLYDSVNSVNEIDKDKLVRELESQFNIWIGTGTILDDDQKDHIPWLANKKSEIDWNFWQRYSRYLEEEKGWGSSTINSLAELTDSILERLEDPEREGNWDRRGMVVGQVQSGKTANYTGLICKAVDAGYKLIIVLAGMQNSLRSQTQLRLDDGFLGFDSQVERGYEQGHLKGAGLISTGNKLIANYATSSSNQGDFNRRAASQFGVTPSGGIPLLFVVKKNKSVLNNLYQWAARQGDREESGQRIIRNVPLLIIDDEADNASINTNPPIFDENGNIEDELDVSAINGLIRKLARSFEQSSYVGYTATPFANIFINPNRDEITNSEYGYDLFPRSFIVNLPAPSNYIGPVQVFGLDTNDNSNLDSSEGLPIIRFIVDHEDWIPNGHKKEHEPGYLPPSLKEAIKAFVLAGAVKIARGKGKEHNSMLLHVTRFTNVQNKVTNQVKLELRTLQRRLKSDDENISHQLIQELKTLWEHDFLPTSQEIVQTIDDPELYLVSWEQVKECLTKAIFKIQVREVNGTAKDVLDYEENKSNGLSVIAVGGNKLSRGLTLEGLTVSYYLRASKMYDTLMQMGRWFGYRPGYADVCRLYTTNDLVEWYEHITLASEELRQEFDYMANSGGTPEDFGLKVRTHPQGLMITGANKMATGTRMELSFAGSISETTIFYKDKNINRKNLETTEDFINNLGSAHKREKENYIWTNVNSDKVINFLSGYESHSKCRVAKTSILTDYIQAQLPMGELVSWTVILISSKSANSKRNIGENEVGLVRRKEADSSTSSEYRIRNSRLLNPTDEWLDLLSTTRDEIMEETSRLRLKSGKLSTSNTPNGRAIREKRCPSKGLILLYPLDPQEIDSDAPVIGFAISFPGSNTATTIEYKVNNIYWEQEFGS